MSESSEGLKGFWNRLSGKSARLEQERQNLNQQAAEQAQKAARAAALAKDRATNFRRQLEAATHVKEVTLEPSTTIDYGSEVADIEEQVMAREIYGKFHPGVILKGQKLVETESPDFTAYGDRQSIPFESGNLDKTPYFMAPWVLEGVMRERADDRTPQSFRDLRKKHFLTRVCVPDSGDEIVSYIFLQDHRDRFSRPSGMAVFNFRLPGQSAARLFALTRKNPEVAEMFLQRAAEGFEADPQIQKPGVGRIRSDEIVLVNLGRFDLNYFNPYVYPYSGALLHEKMASGNLISVAKPLIVSALVENPNGQIERLRYSKPHGVAAPEAIP